MIQVLKAPKEGVVFLSNNPLQIEVKSTLGADHYFKVYLYVNDVLHDEQGWSKYNDTNCKVDLTGMFDNIFDSLFTEVEGDFLNRKSFLMKKIKVIFKEFNRITEANVNTLELNSFYVLKSEEIKYFDNRKNIQKMSELPDEMRISRNSVYRLPLWLTRSSLKVSLLDEGIEFFTKTYNGLTVGIYELDLVIKNFNISSNEIRMLITDGSRVLKQKLLLQDMFVYDISKFYFKNNHGVFEYVELYGSLKETNKYSRKTYKLPNNLSFLASTVQDKSFKINTGCLLPNELSIIEALNNSSEVYFIHNYKFIEVLPISKKSKGLDYQKNYTSDYIEFKVNADVKFNNNFKYD